MTRDTKINYIITENKYLTNLKISTLKVKTMWWKIAEKLRAIQKTQHSMDEIILMVTGTING